MLFMSSTGSRQPLVYAVVVLFLLFFFAVGVRQQIAPNFTIFRTKHDFPDFSQFKARLTLSKDQFPIDDSDRRVIIVGDIHGMDKPFHDLLNKLSYDSTLDVLIHVGDIVSKGKHDGSMAVLSYMASNNITGVRGNHDQKVIEWRSWLDWIHNQRGGRRWLHEMHRHWLVAGNQDVDLETWIDHEVEVDGRDWWKKIPEGWRLFDDHYKIARAMSDSEYQYLLSSPLSLYVPSAHTYIVHAGLLSSDPRHKPTHPRQPLSHVPILPSILKPDKESENATISWLRRLQEMSILQDIPQNAEPWVMLNMRSIAKDNSISSSRLNHGTPWSKLWNSDMSRCNGFSSVVRTSRSRSLPCLASTVLYGHAASRGLDIKRWTVGLDTGCVYGRQLTALVLGSKPHPTSDPTEDIETETQVITFGDTGKGLIVSVAC